MFGNVRGQVIDAESGKPIGFATVTVINSAGPFPDIAPLTDSEGWFLLDGLPVGKWVLGAHGPGGETGEVTVRVSPDSVVNAIIQVR